MDIWEEMYLKAKEEYHPEELSPFIDAHHLERNEYQEEQERAIVASLQDKLYAQQERHDNTGIETRVVMRVTDRKDICDANDRSRNTDYPCGIVPFQ